MPSADYASRNRRSISGRRIIAKDIIENRFLDWDVPLADATCTRELSGPGGLRGKLAPNRILSDDGAPLLREWGTALYYEANGQIRGAGIVDRIAEDDKGFLTVEAPGFTTYPHGIPYLGDYQPGLGASPLQAVREIWNHLQSFPNGDLGVVVVGKGFTDVNLDEVSYTTDNNGNQVEERKPYTLSWWENKDCGNEIESLLSLAPAEYVESHYWRDDHTLVNHQVTLGCPTVGARRDDLRFVEGENIIAPVPIATEGDDFAQNVLGLGMGEGRDMIRSTVTNIDNRLRRVAVVADKTANQQRIDDLAQRTYQAKVNATRARRIVIRDHPNARISAIYPGDTVLIEANPLWFGRRRVWGRVLSIEESIDEGTAVLDLSLA